MTDQPTRETDAKLADDPRPPSDSPDYARALEIHIHLLRDELADERAKKSDALIAAVDDLERLTAERDAAISIGRHALFCVHHTDAERIANTVGGNCPICNKAQIRQLAELAKAKAAEITRLDGLIDAKQSQLKEVNSWLDECVKQRDDALLRLHVTTAERDAARADVARLRAALELIAAPMRPDGTYNRDRAACGSIAREALNTSAQ